MKDDVLHRERQTVSDPTKAQVLADPRALGHLSPFIGRERTVGEVAADLGVTPHAMLYWVKKFLGLKLLHITRTERRRGKPIKRYRAVADGFFIPFQVLPTGVTEELLTQQEAPWQRLLVRNVMQTSLDTFAGLHTWGMYVHHDDKSGITVDIAPSAEEASSRRERLRAPDAPAMLTCWLPLHLSFAEAKAFQHDLMELIERYGNKQGPQRYLARIALTPIVQE